MKCLSFRPFLALGLACSIFHAGTAAAQQVVIVEPVTEVATRPTGRFIGSLRARSTSIMAALEEGALLELAVREADTVRKGQPLARVDSRRLQMSLVQVHADLAMGEATSTERAANLANVVADLAALNKAAESGAISERDLRNARTAVSVAEALLEAAKQSIQSLHATRELLELRIADATVRAAFDPRVVARHAGVGPWIRPGDPLVTMVSTGAMEAWIDVPERFLGSVDTQVAEIALLLEGSGSKVVGVKPRLIPMVDETARTFTLILDVPPTASSMAPGMSVSATIPLGKNVQHMVLHKDAILRRGTAALVARIGPDNMAELVPVQVLFSVAEGFAVQPVEPESLKPGDLVVIEGNERLYPGTPVTPTRRGEEKQEPAPAPK